MKNKISMPLLVISLGFFSSSSQAATLTFDFKADSSSIFSGTGPGGSAASNVFAQAIFEDISPNTVSLTMLVNNYLDPGYVHSWYFNFNDGSLPTINWDDGKTATGVSNGFNSFKADGTGGFFDSRFEFSTSSWDLAKSEKSVYKFSRTGLSVSDFNTKSSPCDFEGKRCNGGNYYAAIHVQGYDNSAWISGTIHKDPPPPVPEPESYAMLLVGLGLLGLTARRKKQRA